VAISIDYLPCFPHTLDVISLMTKLCKFVLLGALVFNTSAYADARYGSSVSFNNDELIQFPDFQIRYIGKYQAPALPVEDGFRTDAIPAPSYEFEVTKGSQIKNISWGTGFGEISPSTFEIGGKCFDVIIEENLIFSDKLTINKFECAR
jgi:hypothetical protein